ncbi:RNA polymerase sigma-70 factor [Parasediminibacterium paludis]|uniref:RNA polymerase sigma-70 factor n=1 Tax=Parasediminibacterium paludis TaxID=908966 RepID=A0ABV8PV83_9BACT
MHIVAEIKAGNKFVFTEVYYKYHERFYFFVLKQTASTDIAEEVVQQAFIKLWESREKLSEVFTIDVQLARITRSILIDTLRKKAIERKVINQVVAQAPTIFSSDPSLEKELKNKIYSAIEGLPPICKKIFKLSREENLSYNEIAEQLSISPKTVENQISKALKVIRQVAALSIILSAINK